MVKTCKSVIAWKIHGSVPFQLVCILFFASVTYEIIDFFRDVPGFQQKQYEEALRKITKERDKKLQNIK